MEAAVLESDVMMAPPTLNEDQIKAELILYQMEERRDFLTLKGMNGKGCAKLQRQHFRGYGFRSHSGTW